MDGVDRSSPRVLSALRVVISEGHLVCPFTSRVKYLGDCSQSSHNIWFGYSRSPVDDSQMWRLAVGSNFLRLFMVPRGWIIMFGIPSLPLFLRHRLSPLVRKNDGIFRLNWQIAMKFTEHVPASQRLNLWSSLHFMMFPSVPPSGQTVNFAHKISKTNGNSLSLGRKLCWVYEYRMYYLQSFTALTRKQFYIGLISCSDNLRLLIICL